MLLTGSDNDVVWTHAHQSPPVKPASTVGGGHAQVPSSASAANVEGKTGRHTGYTTRQRC
jgi:hypothetical protein